MATNNHHRPEILTKTPQEVTQELLEGRRAGGRFWAVALALALLAALGVAGFVSRAGDGFDDHRPWGYLAMVFSFILTTGMSAPLVAVTMRMAKTHFSRPVSRAAELWSVVGLVNLLLLIPLLLALPEAEGRSTFWFVGFWREGWPPGAPHAWVVAAMTALVVNGLAILWVGVIPDMAAGRERASGLRGLLYRRLSMSWRGSKRQWRVLRATLGVLGGFYFMMLVFFHTIVAFDFAESLVPGWRDSIFPAWHALSGLQAGMATVILTLFALRSVGGLKEYIGLDQFWGLAKIMLALSLAWGYFWWSGFIVYWYGRAPVEENILHLLMVGPYSVFFYGAFLLSFLVPAFGLLIWNPIRRSILGPTVAACLILVGTFMDRIRVFVASYNVGLPGQTAPEPLDLTAPTEEFSAIAAGVTPSGADVLMVVGAVAAAVLVYLLATRLLPLINIWETQEGLLLQEVRSYQKLELKVLAKPE